ncbi:MAG TPA: type II toxin-antitoxin system VapC family toxin [Thermoanaerobaculia bacterium]|nr:type II toxin-antitoxin system VapC family toxin [Thermoanaerobaculia bacterium]
MKLLLDSHAFLWWLAGDRKLSAASRQAVADPASIVYVSAATIWELSLKAALGKLDLDGADLVEEIAENAFVELPMTARHSLAAAYLPRHHEDPFDRMLIAQARIEGLTLVTKDLAFRAYEVSILPA